MTRIETAQSGGIEPAITYQQAGVRWFAIEPLTAREQLSAADSQVFAETTHKLTTLYTAIIRHQCQIWYPADPAYTVPIASPITDGTRVFETVGEAINTEEANREQTFFAVEKT
jgi:hypothetical protein